MLCLQPQALFLLADAKSRSNYAVNRTDWPWNQEVITVFQEKVLQKQAPQTTTSTNQTRILLKLERCHRLKPSLTITFEWFQHSPYFCHRETFFFILVKPAQNKSIINSARPQRHTNLLERSLWSQNGSSVQKVAAGSWWSWKCFPEQRLTAKTHFRPRTTK